MGYSREVYRRAEAVLAKRRADAEAQAQERRAAFFAACPRAEEIERLLARTSVAAARTVLAGGNVRETLIKLKEQNQALQAEQAELLRGAGLPADALQPLSLCRLRRHRLHRRPALRLPAPSAARRGLPRAQRALSPFALHI